MTITDGNGGRFASERVLGLITYALLFASVFFVGVPGLVAVVIAYSQKGKSDPAMAGHYRFQVQIFWIGFLLSLIAGICGFWVILDVAGQIWGDGRSSNDFDFETVRHPAQVMALSIAAAVSLVLAILWTLAAPAIGFIRLATAKAPA